MINKIVLFICIFFVWAIPAHAGQRNAVVGQELDCIEQNKNNYLGWKDVCSLPDPSTVNQQIEFNSRDTATSAFSDRVHTFSILPQQFYYHYSEPQKARTVTGVWKGLEGQYTFRPKQGSLLNTPVINYYALESFYADGNYKLKENQIGADGMSIFKVYIKNVPGYTFDDRLLIGRDFIPYESVRLTPYTGFGVWYQTDHSAGIFTPFNSGQVAVLGYNRSSTYYYMPLGLSFDIAATNNYQISLKTEYDFLIKGLQRDDYANFDYVTSVAATPPYYNSNLQYKQNKGFGYRTSLKLLKHFSTVDVYMEPYLYFWDIRASRPAYGNVGGDPNFTNTANRSYTLEIGSSLGVDF